VDIIEILTNIKGRPISKEDEYPSVLASKASKKALKAVGLKPQELDLIIFASAGQDLIEPATANIVQQQLGATCPVFDIKNACNSFLNGLEVARSLIVSGQYEKILVATGETPSKISRYHFENREDFKNGFIGLTLGDAGAAAIVEAKKQGEGIYFTKFMTKGENWQIATLPGGGGRHPFGDDFIKFEGDGTKLKDKFIEVNKSFLDQAFISTNQSFEDFSKIFIHQASYPFLIETIDKIGAPMDKVYVTIRDYGNLVSASIPTAIAKALDRGIVRKEDNILILGLASGISLGIMMIKI
jgi:3-oxoacyl-[acyl-carrier-protein] synthase-3